MPFFTTHARHIIGRASMALYLLLFMSNIRCFPEYDITPNDKGMFCTERNIKKLTHGYLQNHIKLSIGKKHITDVLQQIDIWSGTEKKEVHTNELVLLIEIGLPQGLDQSIESALRENLKYNVNQLTAVNWGNLTPLIFFTIFIMLEHNAQEQAKSINMIDEKKEEKEPYHYPTQEPQGFCDAIMKPMGIQPPPHIIIPINDVHTPPNRPHAPKGNMHHVFDEQALQEKQNQQDAMV